jgi:hypothetical protein
VDPPTRRPRLISGRKAFHIRYAVVDGLASRINRTERSDPASVHAAQSESGRGGTGTSGKSPHPARLPIMPTREDRVFEAVAQRVATGAYLDDVPSSQVPSLSPAPLAAVVEAEDLVGRSLPPLLKRLYLEVGNGGFGPGYGLLGLRDGYRFESSDALSGLRGGVLTLCGWGCGISSLLDLADGQVGGCDPNPAPDGVDCAFPQGLTIVDWFEKWAAGTLYQPWLLQDPETGEWRGATEAETREMLDEAGFA